MSEIYHTLPWYVYAIGIYLLPCLLTSRVDQTRLWDAVKYVNGFFVYGAETGKIEAWRRLSPDNPRGDCEDYALSVIGQYSGRSFLWSVSNMFKFRIWYVKDPKGNAHAIATYGGFGFDNHMKRIAAVGDYKRLGYRFIYPVPFPVIWLKLIMGAIK